MPSVYISPHGDGIKPLADLTASYLKQSGNVIKVFTNEGLTPIAAAKDSNEKGSDFHLVLERYRKPGITVFYSSNDSRSREAADIFLANLSGYSVTEQPDSSLRELVDTKAPAIFIDIGEELLVGATDDLAQIFALSVIEFFGEDLSFSDFSGKGVVNSELGFASVKRLPAASSRDVTKLSNGTWVDIIGKVGNFFAVISDETEGYIQAKDIDIAEKK